MLVPLITMTVFVMFQVRLTYSSIALDVVYHDTANDVVDVMVIGLAVAANDGDACAVNAQLHAHSQEQVTQTNVQC